jgi:hypothetical protein
MTGIDALAVNIGQAHLHGRQEVALTSTGWTIFERQSIFLWCFMGPADRRG